MLIPPTRSAKAVRFQSGSIRFRSMEDFRKLPFRLSEAPENGPVPIRFHPVPKACSCVLRPFCPNRSAKVVRPALARLRPASPSNWPGSRIGPERFYALAPRCFQVGRSFLNAFLNAALQSTLARQSSYFLLGRVGHRAPGIADRSGEKQAARESADIKFCRMLGIIFRSCIRKTTGQSFSQRTSKIPVRREMPCWRNVAQLARPWFQLPGVGRTCKEASMTVRLWSLTRPP